MLFDCRGEQGLKAEMQAHVLVCVGRFLIQREALPRLVSPSAEP